MPAELTPRACCQHFLTFRSLQSGESWEGARGEGAGISPQFSLRVMDGDKRKPVLSVDPLLITPDCGLGKARTSGSVPLGTGSAFC